MQIYSGISIPVRDQAAGTPRVFVFKAATIVAFGTSVPDVALISWSFRFAGQD
jgi:hypothetical protein